MKLDEIRRGIAAGELEVVIEPTRIPAYVAAEQRERGAHVLAAAILEHRAHRPGITAAERWSLYLAARRHRVAADVLAAVVCRAIELDVSPCILITRRRPS